jgi:hypothetical protein
MKSEGSQYYVWEFGDLDLDKQPPPKVASLKGIEDVNFKSGEPISTNQPTVNFIVNRRRKLTDYLFNIPGIPLFSTALQQAIAEIGIDNIQYFTALLVTKKGELVEKGYKIGNVVGKVACFDWEKSEYDETYKARGVPGYIDKLVLDMNRIHGERLFRLAEAPRVLLVSQSVKQHLESKGMRGIKFTEPFAYSG